MTSLPAKEIRRSGLASQRNKTKTHASEILRPLGGKIYELMSSNRPEFMLIDGVQYCRFLDRLYIPPPTTALSTEQIFVINRFRYENFQTDTQFVYNHKIKRVFNAFIEQFNPRTIIEIGPGHSPIDAVCNRSYLGIEIDPNALRFLTKLGVSCGDWLALDQIPPESVDLVVSTFVFHFDVNIFDIQRIYRALAPDGVFIFNVITKDPVVRLYAFDRLSSIGFYGQAFELSSIFGKVDVIFLCQKTEHAWPGKLLSSLLEKT